MKHRCNNPQAREAPGKTKPTTLTQLFVHYFLYLSKALGYADLGFTLVTPEGECTTHFLDYYHFIYKMFMYNFPIHNSVRICAGLSCKIPIRCSL